MNKSFREAVYKMVADIPKGRVMTYGQIAALCEHPGAAQVVGQIAHFGLTELPWQRVVNIRGGMASGFSMDGRHGQARLLENEGIVVKDGFIDLQEYLWWPKR
jgi:methylated-DNA-protein-cysteine methyltransferase-like protein